MRVAPVANVFFYCRQLRLARGMWFMVIESTGKRERSGWLVACAGFSGFFSSSYVNAACELKAAQFTGAAVASEEWGSHLARGGHGFEPADPGR